MFAQVPLAEPTARPLPGWCWLLKLFFWPRIAPTAQLLRRAHARREPFPLAQRRQPAPRYSHIAVGTAGEDLKTLHGRRRRERGGRHCLARLCSLRNREMF